MRAVRDEDVALEARDADRRAAAVSARGEADSDAAGAALLAHLGL